MAKTPGRWPGVFRASSRPAFYVSCRRRRWYPAYINPVPRTSRPIAARPSRKASSAGPVNAVPPAGVTVRGAMVTSSEASGVTVMSLGLGGGVVSLGEGLSLGDGLSDGDGLRLGDGEGLWDGEGEGLSDGDGLSLGEGLSEGLSLGDGDGDSDGDGLSVGDGDSDGEGVSLGLGDGNGTYATE